MLIDLTPKQTADILEALNMLETKRAIEWANAGPAIKPILRNSLSELRGLSVALIALSRQPA